MVLKTGPNITHKYTYGITDCDKVYDNFVNDLKQCFGESVLSKLNTRRTIVIDDSDKSHYFALGNVEPITPVSDIDILFKAKYMDNNENFFNIYLHQLMEVYKNEMPKKTQQEVEQKAGFDTGDGLAQNINANPVSDNKPKESATGLTFDTVPAPIKINKFGIWCEEIDTFLTDVESLHERKDGRVWLFAGKETSQNPFTEVIKAVYLGEDKDVDVGWQNDKDKVRENISRLRERNNAQEIGDIIFWHLLALAVDDDLWRNNIANVTDWAYCLGFDTQMLQDWCQMVRYVLEGNKLGAYCRYVVKTEQGKKYFHIDCAA